MKNKNDTKLQDLLQVIQYCKKEVFFGEDNLNQRVIRGGKLVLVGNFKPSPSALRARRMKRKRLLELCRLTTDPKFILTLDDSVIASLMDMVLTNLKFAQPPPRKVRPYDRKKGAFPISISKASWFHLELILTILQNLLRGCISKNATREDHTGEDEPTAVKTNQHPLSTMPIPSIARAQFVNDSLKQSTSHKRTSLSFVHSSPDTLSHPKVSVRVSVCLQPYIDAQFVRHLLHNFSSQDQRERTAIKIIALQIYNIYPFLREEFRIIFLESFQSFAFNSVYQTPTSAGTEISGLLDLLYAILNEFGVEISPSVAVRHQFFCKGILPLLRPRINLLARYHQTLLSVLFVLTIEQPFLATDYVRALLRFWPVQSSCKQALFLYQIHEIFFLLSQAGLQNENDNVSPSDQLDILERSEISLGSNSDQGNSLLNDPAAIPAPSPSSSSRALGTTVKTSPISGEAPRGARSSSSSRGTSAISSPASRRGARSSSQKRCSKTLSSPNMQEDTIASDSITSNTDYPDSSNLPDLSDLTSAIISSELHPSALAVTPKSRRSLPILSPIKDKRRNYTGYLQELLIPLFKRICSCVRESHADVATDAICLLDSAHVFAFICEESTDPQSVPRTSVRLGKRKKHRKSSKNRTTKQFTCSRLRLLLPIIYPTLAHVAAYDSNGYTLDKCNADIAQSPLLSTDFGDSKNVDSHQVLRAPIPSLSDIKMEQSVPDFSMQDHTRVDLSRVVRIARTLMRTMAQADPKAFQDFKTSYSQREQTREAARLQRVSSWQYYLEFEQQLMMMRKSASLNESDVGLEDKTNEASEGFAMNFAAGHSASSNSENIYNDTKKPDPAVPVPNFVNEPPIKDLEEALAPVIPLADSTCTLKPKSNDKNELSIPCELSLKAQAPSVTVISNPSPKQSPAILRPVLVTPNLGGQEMGFSKASIRQSYSVPPSLSVLEGIASIGHPTSPSGSYSELAPQVPKKVAPRANSAPRHSFRRSRLSLTGPSTFSTPPALPASAGLAHSSSGSVAPTPPATAHPNKHSGNLFRIAKASTPLMVNTSLKNSNHIIKQTSLFDELDNERMIPEAPSPSKKPKAPLTLHRRRIQRAAITPIADFLISDRPNDLQRSQQSNPKSIHLPNPDPAMIYSEDSSPKPHPLSPARLTLGDIRKSRARRSSVSEQVNSEGFNYHNDGRISSAMSPLPTVGKMLLDLHNSTTSAGEFDQTNSLHASIQNRPSYRSTPVPIQLDFSGIDVKVKNARNDFKQQPEASLINAPPRDFDCNDFTGFDSMTHASTWDPADLSL